MANRPRSGGRAAPPAATRSPIVVAWAGGLGYQKRAMNKAMHTALLPAGLRDALPEEAEMEAAAVHCLMTAFERQGYRRVKPPLLEFETGLLTGPGRQLSGQVFRLMDPISQKMMGLRADITPQIARLASTRLASAPRPLRLCYSGQVLRVRGDQLRPERQFTQAGIEIFGADAVAAEAEIVLLVVEALRAAGLKGITVDLTVPALAPMVLTGQGYDEDTAQAAREALDAKDAGELRACIGEDDTVFGLLDAVGEAGGAIPKLRALGISGQAGLLVDRLSELVAEITGADPDLSVTIDPGEFRGFEYQSGIAFAVFARGVRGEIARGGRYRSESGETAVGATVYLDSVLRALPRQVRPARIYLPAGTAREASRSLKADGWTVVHGLEKAEDVPAEARRQGCSHVFRDGAAVALD